METNITLSDVKLVPADWSDISSRKDVSTTNRIVGLDLSLPLIASNMDTVYSPLLAQKVQENGGAAIVHRFCGIETNVKLFQEYPYTWVSLGVGEYELKRAKSLYEAGAKVFLLDVANAAASHVLEQYNNLNRILTTKCKVIVGSFGTKEQINAFCSKTDTLPDAVLIGQGNGSACITSLVTGVGIPSFSCIQDCKNNKYDIPVILNGGVSNSGDFAKALAAGASAVVVGRLFAQCSESGAKSLLGQPNKKIYRGSASLSSYETQGKVAEWRAPEGEEFLIDVTGTVEQFMQQMSGGLRSSMTYCNAKTIKEFQENAKFIQVTNNGLIESKAYGRG